MMAVTRGLRVVLALLVCLPAVARAATVAAGAEHTVVVTPDGHVWTWGRNEYGQLGDGGASGSTGRRVPTQVPGLSNIIAVATNTFHTLALASDGTVWAWGANWYGQVGNGSTANQLTPVQLSLTNIIAIGAGNEHSVALANDGTLWSWGDNYFGQLGRSSSGRYDPTPTAVSVFGTSSALVSIAAGSEHTLVRKADGTVWGVGGDWCGQLGDGSTALGRSSPVQATGITTAVAIAGIGAHAIVRLSDGTIAPSVPM
jgi:alpha-tubulin suppressor-like RCC1 family protein